MMGYLLAALSSELRGTLSKDLIFSGKNFLPKINFFYVSDANFTLTSLTFFLRQFRNRKKNGIYKTKFKKIFLNNYF